MMKQKATGMLPYLIVLALNYYALPFLITNTGMAMFILLGVIPLISMVCAFICGVRQGFHWLFLLCGTVLFIPSIWIFYNSSACFYVVVYGIILLIGNTLGMLLHKKR